jgi:hypothetical protein
LRQRSFAGVHQQQYAIDDFQSALDFTAEIAVARRVDNVDFDAVISHAGGFGEDGDTAFAFKIVGIHHPFGDFLVGSKNAALAQHGVDQRGLSVIDVSDDGYVANFVTSHNHPLSTGSPHPAASNLFKTNTHLCG